MLFSISPLAAPFAIDGREAAHLIIDIIEPTINTDWYYQTLYWLRFHRMVLISQPAINGFSRPGRHIDTQPPQLQAGIYFDSFQATLSCRHWFIEGPNSRNRLRVRNTNVSGWDRDTKRYFLYSIRVTVGWQASVSLRFAHTLHEVECINNEESQEMRTVSSV